MVRKHKPHKKPFTHMHKHLQIYINDDTFKRHHVHSLLTALADVLKVCVFKRACVTKLYIKLLFL